METKREEKESKVKEGKRVLVQPERKKYKIQVYLKVMFRL